MYACMEKEQKYRDVREQWWWGWVENVGKIPNQSVRNRKEGSKEEFKM